MSKTSVRQIVLRCAFVFGCCPAFATPFIVQRFAGAQSPERTAPGKSVAQLEAEMARAKAALKRANDSGDTAALRAADAEYQALGRERQTALFEEQPNAAPQAAAANPLGASGKRYLPPPEPNLPGRRGDVDDDFPDLEDDERLRRGEERPDDFRPIDPDDEEYFDLLEGAPEDLYANMGAPDFKVPPFKLMIDKVFQKAASKQVEIDKWYAELRDIDATGRRYQAAGGATSAQIQELGRRQERAFAELRSLGENPTYGGTIGVPEKN